MPSKHLPEKEPVLIRPLVLKLPIDFHCGGLWGSDLLWFLAHTNAKLSHLEAGSVFRDSGSATTPPPSQFISIRWNFFFSGAAEFHYNGSAAEVLGTQFPASFHQPQLNLGLTLLLYYSLDFITLTQMQQSERAECS